MIAKITRGARAGDLAAYLHGPGRANEHVYDGRVGGVVIGGNLGREGSADGTGWAIDLREAASNRPDVAKPIWHMSLRCAPQDRRLSDAEWAEVALEMGERMGWAEWPWVVVRHADDHVHVALSRVGHDGQLWYGKNDAREAQRARGSIEQRLGLVRTPTRSTRESKRVADHLVSQGEYARGARTGRVPQRVQLAIAVRGAVNAAQGLGRGVFEDTLRAAGVEFRVNEASTGRVSGYSVHVPGHADAAGRAVWFKTSQLDRELSWNRIAQRLEQPVERKFVPAGMKRQWLESSARFEQRVEQAAIAVKQRQVRAVWPTFAQDVQQALPNAFWQERQQQRREVGVAGAQRVERERAQRAGAQGEKQRPQMTAYDWETVAGLHAGYGMSRGESVARAREAGAQRPAMTQEDRQNLERLHAGYGMSRGGSLRRASRHSSQQQMPPEEPQRGRERDYGR